MTSNHAASTSPERAAASWSMGSASVRLASSTTIVPSTRSAARRSASARVAASSSALSALDQRDGARRPAVVECLHSFELEHPCGLGAVGAPRRAELADQALVGHAELDAEFLHAHHHRGAVRLEDAEVRDVVHHGVVIGEHADLGKCPSHRRHLRVRGDRTVRTFEIGEIGDRQHHDQTDRDPVEPDRRPSGPRLDPCLDRRLGT